MVVMTVLAARTESLAPLTLSNNARVVSASGQWGLSSSHSSSSTRSLGWIATVTGFVKMLTTTIDFGATIEGAPVLAAMGDLAVALGSELKSFPRPKPPAGP